MRPWVRSGAVALAGLVEAASGMGPIVDHVAPLSLLRSTQMDHACQASTDVPLTMTPSSRTSGLARMGPSRPAGRCSTGDQVCPSSRLNFRAATQSEGAGPYL